jgi:hypothetical protein
LPWRSASFCDKQNVAGILGLLAFGMFLRFIDSPEQLRGDRRRPLTKAIRLN